MHWLSLLPLVVVSATGAEAPGIAVFNTATASGASTFVSQLRAELASRAPTVLDASGIRARLLGPSASHPTASADDAAARLEQVAALEAQGKPQDAITALDALVQALDADPEPTVGKSRLLEQARLTLARLLLATGKPQDARRAHAQLVQVLRVDGVELATPSPAMTSAVDEARAAVKDMPRGSLTVESAPAGVTVMLEGRALGETPLRLEGAAPVGRYRLWLEHDGQRTLPRTIELGPGGAQLSVDVALERRIAEVPGTLDADPADVDVELARKLASITGSETVVIASEYPCNNVTCGGVVVYSAPEQAIVRRGEAVLGDAAAVSQLASFILSGTQGDRLRPYRPTGTAPRRATIAVLPLEGALASNDRERLQAALKSGVLRAAPVQLVPAAHVDRVLAASRADEPVCTHGLACLTVLAEQLKADAVISARLVERKGSWFLVAEVVDAASWSRRAIDVPVGTLAHAEPRVGQAATLLLAPERYRGNLVLNSAVRGARLWIDGVEAGETPLPGPITGLVPGTHSVRLVGRGLDEATRTVEVAPWRVVRLVAEPEGRALVIRQPGAPTAEAADVDIPEERLDMREATPLWPYGVAAVGGGLAAISAPIGVFGLAMATAGAYLLATSPRTPGGSFVAEPGETAEQAQLRVGGLLALTLGGVAVLALGALLFVGGLTAVVVGVVLRFLL